jgi:hypothetical protein
VGQEDHIRSIQDHSPPTVVQVAEAHSKLRERDATSYFEPLLALCFLFEGLESQATQRRFNQTAGECGRTRQGLSELSSNAWGKTLVHGSDRPISPND